MRIECEICGSYADLEKPPLNNICPVCFSVGSLFICEVKQGMDVTDINVGNKGGDNHD